MWIHGAQAVHIISKQGQMCTDGALSVTIGGAGEAEVMLPPSICILITGMHACVPEHANAHPHTCRPTRKHARVHIHAQTNAGLFPKDGSGLKIITCEDNNKAPSMII